MSEKWKFTPDQSAEKKFLVKKFSRDVHEIDIEGVETDIESVSDFAKDPVGYLREEIAHLEEVSHSTEQGVSAHSFIKTLFMVVRWHANRLYLFDFKTEDERVKTLATMSEGGDQLQALASLAKDVGCSYDDVYQWAVEEYKEREELSSVIEMLKEVYGRE